MVNFDRPIHSGETDQIEKFIIELNLGGKKISTEQTGQTDLVYKFGTIKEEYTQFWGLRPLKNFELEMYNQNVAA